MQACNLGHKKYYAKLKYFNSHQEIETTLYHLPKPGLHHLDTLQHLLLRVEAEWGLGPADVQHREAVAERVNIVVTAGIQGASVRLYGSCYTAFGLKDSSLDLDLMLPENLPPHRGLLQALQLFSTNPMFRYFCMNFI